MAQKCKPRCGLNNGRSHLTYGCTNGRVIYRARVDQKKKKGKSCPTNFEHVPFTKICRSTCPGGFIHSSTKCRYYSKCADDFESRKNGRYCKPIRRNMKWNRPSCAHTTNPSRFNYVSSKCMQVCKPGEGETPIGLCVEKSKPKIFSIESIIDAIASEFSESCWLLSFLYSIV